MMKKTGKIIEIIICVISLALALGTKTFISACGPKDDGSYMSCHWAEQGAFAFGIMMFALSLMLLLERDISAKRGLAMALVPASILIFAIPGRLIDLCMMADMHCHTHLEPGVHIFSLIILVLAIVEYIALMKGEQKDRK